MYFYTTRTMSQQIERMNAPDLDELYRIKGNILRGWGNDYEHRLNGGDFQGGLRGAWARDFHAWDGWGGWRLVYRYDGPQITLLGIMDYHGGGAYLPLYRLHWRYDVNWGHDWY